VTTVEQQENPERETRPSDPEPDDSALMLRSANGDRWAFDRLVRRYYRKVYSTSYRLLGNPQEAEDATQEIFLKVYKAARSFQPHLSFSTWLYRISVNHCLNVLRWKRRRRFLSLNALLRPDRDEPDPEEFSSFVRAHSSSRPDEQLEKSERAEAVRRAIESLPEKQRVAVILHRYEGLSYKEIAEVMGTSVSSVESRLHRAKVALAAKLADLLEIETPSGRSEGRKN